MLLGKLKALNPFRRRFKMQALIRQKRTALSTS
jgi:hypothetical protein